MKFWFKKRPRTEHEQRVYVRISTVFPVELRFVDKLSGKPVGKSIQCFTRDISKGGMCLQVYAPQPSFLEYLNSDQYRLSLVITPPFSKRPITAFAQKAWQKTIKDQGIDQLLMGVRYDNIIESDRKRLYAYVNSLRRKPYEIALTILLLIIFASYMYYHYYSAKQNNQKLHRNLDTLQHSDQNAQKQLEDLKKREIALKSELSTKDQETSQLKQNITAIAINQTDEKVEAFIHELQNNNSALKEALAHANTELASTRDQLLTYKNKTYALHILGNDETPAVKENESLDIITLHNTNILVGHIVNKAADIVELSLINGTQTTLFATEIAGIVTVKLVDYNLYHKDNAQGQDSSVNSKDVSHRDTSLDFLKRISYDTFKYFISERNNSTGLVKDNSDPQAPANIAVTGLSLVIDSLACEKGWLSFDDAYAHVLTTLKTADTLLEQEHGFYYRFYDSETGKRSWNSEVSSMDTALFLAGALTAGAYFQNSEVSTLAEKLYQRADWSWMSNNKTSLCMGWKPEVGFLPYYWHTFNECLLAYILAIASPTHPLPVSYWDDIERPTGTYGGHELVYSQTGSLNVYQIPAMFVNFKDLSDRGVNYWTNTKEATLANRQFCIDNKDTFPAYGENSWGLTPSDGPNGFRGYGAKPGINTHDGTVAPSAAAGSMPFTPEESLAALSNMYESYKDHLYGFYGFRDSFNLNQGWFSNKYIGLNQALTLIMIENHLSQFAWQQFMKTEVFATWKKLCLDRKENPKN